MCLRMCSLRLTGLRRKRCYLFWEILSTEALWSQGQMLDTLLVSTLCIGHLSGPVDTSAGHCQRTPDGDSKGLWIELPQEGDVGHVLHFLLRIPDLGLRLVWTLIYLSPSVCLLASDFHTFVYVWLPRECFRVTIQANHLESSFQFGFCFLPVCM